MDLKKLKLEDIKKILQSKKTIQIVSIIGVLGIVIIFISSFFDVADEGHNQNSMTITLNEYGETLQNELAIVVQSIEGVGRAKVFVTMEDSPEGVYLNNKDIKTKEIEPRVRGVIVVCDGATNPIVAERVIDAVTKGLSIPSSKVSVTKLVGQ